MPSTFSKTGIPQGHTGQDRCGLDQQGGFQTRGSLLERYQPAGWLWRPAKAMRVAMEGAGRMDWLFMGGRNEFRGPVDTALHEGMQHRGEQGQSGGHLKTLRRDAATTCC